MPKTKDNQARQKLIWIVNDEVERCRSLQAALTAAGYAVENTSNADDLSARSSSRRPDVILVDPRMPGPEGLRTAQIVLLDPQLRDIPVLALAPPSNPPDPSTDLFDGYWSEGVDPAELLRQIQALPALSAPPAKPAEAAPSALPAEGDLRARADAILDSIAGGLPQSQFAPDTSAALHRLAAAIASPEDGALSEYLERAERLAGFRTVRSSKGFRSVVRLCRDVLGRDPDPSPEFEALRVEYLDNRASELHALNRALRRSDFGAVATAGHNLKGTGAAYGFAELTELGRALEIAAKDRDGARSEALLGDAQFYLSLVVRRPATGPGVQ